MQAKAWCRRAADGAHDDDGVEDDSAQDGRGDGDLREFFPEKSRINFHYQVCLLLLPVRLGAPLHQPDGVLAELLQGLDLLRDLVHYAF